MASSRSLLLGTRRNNQVSNSRSDDYQPDRESSQIFHRRRDASDNRNNYRDSHSNRYSDTHSDHYLDGLQDRQSSNVGIGWNNHHSDSLNDPINGRNERHLENEYDQYMSELHSKSRYSDVGVNSTNSDLGRNRNLRDFDRNLDTNDLCLNLERNSVYSKRERNLGLEMMPNNTLSNLVKSNHLLELERGNLHSNLGTSSITPWQVGAGPANTTNIHPLDAVSNKVVSTIELANNLLNLFQQQPQHNNPPSLLDLPVHAPRSKPFNSGSGRTSMGNQQHSATDFHFGAGKRKSHWGPAGQSQLNKNLSRKDNNISSKPKARTSNLSNAGNAKPIRNAKKTENKVVDTEYNDILPNLLYCHICKKSIAESKSFATHLKGKVHAAMIVKTEKEYALAADQMREEIRAVESLKSNRHNSLNFHCSMCNLDAGDPREHRSSAGHRKLKKYLHPTCQACNLNFATKIQYDEHILTPDHLKKIQGKEKPELIQNTEAGTAEKTEKDGPKVMQIFTMDMEKSYVRERFDKKRGRKTTKEDKSKDNVSKEQNEKKKDDKAAVDSDNLVLDYMEGDDLTGVTPNMLPAYNTERGVGDSFLAEFRCVQCKLCNKLFDSAETAKIHLKTWGHHRLFTKLILNKIKSTDRDNNQNKDSGSPDAKQKKSNKESGDWKRRKTSESFVAVQKEQEDEEMAENDENGPDSQLPPNDELEDWDQEDEKVDINQEKDDDDDVILVE